MSEQERVYTLPEAATLIGVPLRRLRRTLLAAQKENGNILTKISRYYYVSDSSLRTLFPLLFTNTKSKLEKRFEEMEGKLEILESKLLEARQNIFSLRNRVKDLEKGTK